MIILPVVTPGNKIEAISSGVKTQDSLVFIVVVFSLCMYQQYDLLKTQIVF